jgi:alginate O-acetyltransferase complex protein AlgI
LVFSSITFLVWFLPAVVLGYLVAGKRFRNGFLLAASVFFYSWGAPRFIFVILGTTFLDFYIVRAMAESNTERKRKMLLCSSLVINLGLLFYFKYCNFFIDNLNALFGLAGKGHLSTLSVVLPIGISFYTFETITYVVDVYRRVHSPLKNFWNYQLYIILFPKLIAGPIIRYHEIADQIADRSSAETPLNRISGFHRFCIGLSKKVFIANTMAVVADQVFAMHTSALNTPVAWLGAAAYTFQIYFDFSGYSDMAIGLGKIFGFHFPENFNSPYVSGSITEFWRRWHITLGKWMKNYLYIPLGGNRVAGKGRLFFNLWLVFLLSGFWHGASWTFVIWGIYHGTFLVMERTFLLKIYHKTGRLIATLATFVITVTGWVFFRSESISTAFAFIRRMFSFDFGAIDFYTDPGFRFFFILAIIFSFFTYAKAGEKIMARIYFSQPGVSTRLIYTFVAILLYTLALGTIASGNFNPFIYFRF